MQPLYLYIENFTSHEKSEIDFSSFNSALIIGKVDNNDLISNGVGKTSIFRSIEYALFNQVRDPLLSKDIVLEKLIRDEAQKMLVIFDFILNDEIYRVIRSRTRKGISDLSFYKRNAVETTFSFHVPETDIKLWDDIASRRTADTEADLTKLIRINYKSFMNTMHFMQSDMSGLATATPENRRKILKDSLELLIYVVLEKLAKKRADDILKHIEKNKTILAQLGLPQKDIDDLTKKLVETEMLIANRNADKTTKKEDLDKASQLYTELISQLNVLEAGTTAVITKRDNLMGDVSKIQNSITEYSNKVAVIVRSAKKLAEEFSELKTKIVVFDGCDFSQLILTQQSNINEWNDSIAKNNIALALNNAELEELRIPLPKDGKCKHCRQQLTDAHRRVCMDEIKNQIKEKEKILAFLTDEAKHLATMKQEGLLSLQKTEKKKYTFDEISSNLVSTNKEIFEKKKIYEEFKGLLDQFNLDLLAKQEDLKKADVEIQNSSAKELDELKKNIWRSKRHNALVELEYNALLNEINDFTAKKAVFEHSIQEKQKDIKRKLELEKETLAQEEKYALHPLVIQAFGNIPDMIIENILEDLQDESNKLLAQIRPGLQLSFLTEKTKGDGTQDDTLQINYFLNNKPRDYSQLSGAQRLCIAFSLKLGLSFLLAKTLGAQIKFLLLDEVDQSLDKAGVDAFADIIKFFQNDFKILVITHNDRLKDKFSHAILVEQDQNMVSRAHVATSW